MKNLDLPIGESTFQNIREWDFYYVDKTAHIFKLARKPGYYFLSRPRRFGKTLLVDTIQELFEGNEKLFQGLHIYDRWDWTVKNPVLRLSFDGKYNKPNELEKDVIEQLEIIEHQNQLNPAKKSNTGPNRLRNVLNRLYYTTGQKVVVLVDEYDKPILDLLEKPKLANANREYLHGIYGMIKGCARYIRFIFITGISMYSKVSLFSGMNNLEDISLDPEFATICGYTDSDIDTVFASELKGLDRDEIRHWYNGYNWLGEAKVYNPFDVLLLFKKRQFEPYWYETGTPRYLYRLMAQGAINPLNLESLEMERSELSNFDVEEVSVNALLFQCGYLTLADRAVRPEGIYYTLEYPNHEVQLNLNKQLVGAVSGNLKETEKRAKNMLRFLTNNDFKEFEAELHSFFSAMPNGLYKHSRMQHYEGYYAGMVYACFIAIGVDVTGEESTSRGRSDLVVVHASQVFVMEFKMAKTAELEAEAADAIAQIRSKDYAGKYRNRRGKIHLLGVVFSGKDRNVATIMVERD